VKRADLSLVPEHLLRNIGPGRPAMGYYGMGTHWYRWARDICAKERALAVSECELLFPMLSSEAGRSHYEGGAPYFMVGSDWLDILPRWIALLSPMKKRYDGIESDMYAWAMASQELNATRRFEHTVVELQQTCMADDSKPFLEDESSTFVHYCQRYFSPEVRGAQYEVQKGSEFLSETHTKGQPSDFVFSFSKYWMAMAPPDSVLGCDTPLLVEPPVLTAEQRALLTPKLTKYYKVLWKVVPAVNDALAEFKIRFCVGVPNLSKALLLQERHRASGDTHVHVLKPSP
jgi:hypothetical protein